MLDYLQQQMNMSKKKKIPLAKYLNPNALHKVHFTTCNSNRNVTIKLKFGIKDVQEEISNLKILSQNNPNAMFRIDFNGKYQVPEMISICKQLKKYNISYIEEPLTNSTVEDYQTLKKHVPIPFAIDESIIKGKYKDLVSNKLVDYAILKAPIYGSVKKIIQLNNFLINNHVQIIASSALQTKIGNMANIHIASALENNIPCGLNNHKFFNYKYKMPYALNDNNCNIKNIFGLGVEWND